MPHGTCTAKTTVSKMFSASFIQYFAVIELLITLSDASEVLRPRGVSLAKAGLYDPSKDFTCFDGSAIIPFIRVNDDYCDCRDGSDEPGTAACPNGSFHCSNAGHKSLNIPSSRVNDGVCDCCDASDEYDSPANCVNNCGELGAAALAEAMQLAEVSRKGNELRLSLSQQGKQMRQEKQERMQQLEKEKEEVERIKQEKEQLKAVAEEVERAALEKYKRSEEEERQKQREEDDKEEEREIFEKFQLLDSNGDGKITMVEIQTRITFDQNRDGVVSEDEAKYFLSSTGEMDWEEFHESGYSNMKPYFLMESGLFKPPEPSKDDVSTDTVPGDDPDHNEEVVTESGLPEESEDAGKGEDDDQYDDDSDDVDKEEEDEEEETEGEVEETKNEEEKEPPKYDEETQRLIDGNLKTKLL
ncbi:hypothetical protein J437_LFUL014908 [Ladona fulva]|uniref:EF-hand domain-containing protein n=1 Tax=Ladona fulva TaxID=123851 RepID=A0A8K0KJV0_LADFU|nr:hypothetical protein J437_LFUL014908 [Ladona fulva]